MPDSVLQENILEVVISRGDLSGDSFSEVRSKLDSWGVAASRKPTTSALFDLVGRGQLTLRRPVVEELNHGYGCVTIIRGYHYGLPTPASGK